MIFVDRHESGVPITLRSKNATNARTRATRFFRQPPEDRAQELFEFDSEIFAATDVLITLTELFSSKCAYCEAPSAAGNLFVEQFRPADGAINLNGSFAPDHYWWLAYEWENLLPVCADCSNAKGSRFPVAAPRAQPGAQASQLADEAPLLIDPCSDDPEAHLVYGEDGYVSSGTAPGSTTIELLALNRPTLVAARATALRESRAEWQHSQTALDPTVAVRLGDPATPYAAIRRQFLKQWLTETGTAAISKLMDVLGDAGIVDKQQQDATREVFSDFEEKMRTFSVAPQPPGVDPYSAGIDPSYYITARTIRRIEIRNFKTLRRLDLDFPEATSSRSPWLMLLGENGYGKSSVLQALVLTLMGEHYRAALGIDARQVLSWGTPEGYVRVQLSGSDAPVELTFSEDSPLFRSTPAEPQVLLMAYGATRLLPRRADTQQPIMFGARDRTRFANVENLFDPFVPLNEPRDWLMTLDDEHFLAVARGLRRLLPLEGIKEFERGPDGVRVRVFGQALTLEQLSDGYQCVLALATDMMQVLLHRWPAVEIAEGIIAIDELEAHLHPNWRMRIVSSLREVFPRLQFLTTTHDPLCLRGLEDGEVIVLRRDSENNVFAVDDLPSVKGLRVDQLLTSEIFGLDSTSDPEVDSLLDEYRELRWLQEPSAASRERQRQIQARLDQLQLLGHTTRERLMLEAIDEYLAEQRQTADPGRRADLKESTRRRLRAILAETPDAQLPPAP